MACEVEPWNFTSVAKEYQDDYELAKSVISQNKNQTVFIYLSKRLKDDLSLALLDVECNLPGVDTYSKRLKDNDEIAKKLIEIHGEDCWMLHDMSKRIQKKYLKKRK